MAKKVSTKKPLTGNRRSHALNATKHAQKPNFQKVTVNGVKVDIPSYQVRINDVVAVKENSLDHAAIKEAVETCVSRPAYVEFDKNKMCGKMLRLPDRSELNAEINETLIVEYYNR